MNLSRLYRGLLILVVLGGCTDGKVSAPPSSNTAAKGNAAEPNAERAQAGATSNEVLASAIHQLIPENFGLNTTPEKSVSLLNSWRLKAARERNVTEEPSPVKAPDGWILAADEERLAQARFDLNDAVHIRDAMLYQAIAGYLSDRAKSEAERAAAVVDYVCRNVALWKDDEIEVALPPFRVLQLGHGSADDRAWVCAEILRQLRFDSFIIRAASDKKENSDKWLLGIGVEGQVYLYDMQLGLPIGRNEGTLPATLTELESHPEWLELMSTDKPYRLTAADLKDPAIAIVPDPLFWCRRMHNLEQVLPPNDACVIYDPVMDEGNHKGLLTRVSESYHWPRENLKAWPHPRRQSTAAQHPTPEAQQELTKLLIPLSVPIPFKVDDKGQVTIGTPERRLERIRMDQMLGRFAEATERYLRIRHLEVERHPPEIEQINKVAAENAFYWTAVCKYEMGEYESAIEQLTALLKKHDRKGTYYFPARSLLAQCHIHLKQIAEAKPILERIAADDPYKDANAIRLKRLK